MITSGFAGVRGFEMRPRWRSCHSRFKAPPAIAVAAALTVSVGGCGLYTPKIQEAYADDVSGQQLVQSIIYNVTCEVRDAVDYVYNNPSLPRPSTFLDTWGANIALNLQVEEKSSISPTVVGMPPSPATALFSIAGSATVSANATMQDKLNSYYTIAELRRLGRCNPQTRPGGVLLMQHDLGLSNWLNANVIAAERQIIHYAQDYTDLINKTNVLSHEIKFELTTTGTLTPAWKLTRALVNQSGTLLSATRDRTNDLTVTFGPTLAQPKLAKNGTPLRDRGGRVLTSASGPSAPAVEAALASQIGLAVSNALRSRTIP